MKKRIFSGVLAAAVLLAGCITAYAATVPADVKGSSYEEAVSALIEQGVVSGYSDGSFRPAAAVNRGEACAMVVKYMGAGEEDLKAAANSTFTDMGNPEYSWAQKYVDYGVSAGIVKGYSDGSFRPGAAVTYEELGAMLVNAMGYTSSDLTGLWPANYINKANDMNLFRGIAKSRIGEIPANRGDVALVVYNAVKWDLELGEGKNNFGSIGDKLTNSFFEFTVKSVSSLPELKGHMPPQEGYQYVTADIEVKNVDELKQAIPVGNYDFMITWTTNGKAESDAAFESFMDGMYPDSVYLDYGKTLSGKLVFQVPSDVTEVGIYYTEVWDDDFAGDTYTVKCSLN